MQLVAGRYSYDENCDYSSLSMFAPEAYKEGRASVGSRAVPELLTAKPIRRRIVYSIETD